MKFGTANPPPTVSSNQSGGIVHAGHTLEQHGVFLAIVARNGSGTTTGPVWSFQTAAAGGGGGTLPAPWTTTDVGSVGSPAARPPRTARSPSGRRRGHLGHVRLVPLRLPAMNGDCRIVARVPLVQNTNAYAKGRRDAAQSTTRRIRARRFSTRARTAASIHDADVERRRNQLHRRGFQSSPPWLRLTRSGSTVTASVSSNGIVLDDDRQHYRLDVDQRNIGLAVTSHDTLVLNTSTFDNVTVTTGGGATAAAAATAAGERRDLRERHPGRGAARRVDGRHDATSPTGVKLVTPDAGVAQHEQRAGVAVRLRGRHLHAPTRHAVHAVAADEGAGNSNSTTRCGCSSPTRRQAARRSIR